jgi:hypothetical protein
VPAGLSVAPGTAKTVRPYSTSCSAMLSAPLFWAASTMTTPRDSPLVASMEIPFSRADVEGAA